MSYARLIPVSLLALACLLIWLGWARSSPFVRSYTLVSVSLAPDANRRGDHRVTIRDDRGVESTYVGSGGWWVHYPSGHGCSAGFALMLSRFVRAEEFKREAMT